MAGTNIGSAVGGGVPDLTPPGEQLLGPQAVPAGDLRHHGARRQGQLQRSAIPGAPSLESSLS
jgi:hypothetical protein